MKSSYLKITLLSLFVMSACSLPPERKLTLEQLKKSDLAYYVVKDNLNSVLSELNKTGEAVVTVELYGKEFLVKIYATSKEGLLIKQFQEK